MLAKMGRNFKDIGEISAISSDTHGDCAGNVSRFLPPIDDAAEEEEGSDVPGNGGEEEPDDEPCGRRRIGHSPVMNSAQKINILGKDCCSSG